MMYETNKGVNLKILLVIFVYFVRIHNLKVERLREDCQKSSSIKKSNEIVNGMKGPMSRLIL